MQCTVNDIPWHELICLKIDIFALKTHSGGEAFLWPRPKSTLRVVEANGQRVISLFITFCTL